MTRTMIYLPEGLHRGLKHLAVERATSLTALIREAVEALYREDLEDFQIGRERLKDYVAHPERAVPYAQVRAKRLRHRISRRSERTYKRLP